MNSNDTITHGFNTLHHEDTLKFDPKQIFIPELPNVVSARNKAVKVSLYDFANNLSNPNKADFFTKFRAMQTGEAQDEVKKTAFKSYTISLDINGERTGLLCGDIDKIRANYNKTPTAVLADVCQLFPVMIGTTSVRGDGIFFIMRYPVENVLQEVFNAIEYDLKTYLGYELDYLADEKRQRLDSYDPATYINWEAGIYTDTLQEEKKEATPTTAPSDFAEFDKYSSDPAINFNNEIERAFEIINPLAEAKGFTVTKGKGKEPYIYHRPGGQPRSIVAMDNEVIIKYSVKSSTLIKEIGKNKLNNVEFFKFLISSDDNHTTQKELAKLGFGTFHEAQPMKPNAKESYSLMLDYLKNEGIKLNQLTGVIEINGLPLTDYHLSKMLTELSLFSDKNQSKEILLSCIDVIANERQFHPFIEFVKELDKVEPTDFLEADELDKFIDCFTSDTPKGLIRIYLIRWMLGLFDLHFLHRMTKNVLILSGAQNSGKTSFGKNTLPEILKSYGKVVEFNPNKMTDSKIALCSILVACFDEFEDILIKPKTLSEFKNLTSSYDIFERRPYRRNHEQMFRSSIIMATTNEKNILTDSTGNTRFLTIDVQAFDLNKYFTIDLLKLWRVVYDLHLLGETSVLNEVERALQSIENTNFESEDFVAGLVENIFKYDIDGFLTSTEIMIELEKNTKQSLSLKRIGSALRKMGIERIAKKINRKVLRGYNLKFHYEN